MPNPLDPNERSSYLDYLPAIFQQDSVEGRPNFLGRYLLAFEQVLTGLGNPQSPGLEEILNGAAPTVGNTALSGVHRYFEPGGNLNGTAPKLFTAGERAPAEFLEWLSAWVALSLRADLSEEQQRNFIAQAVPLYRLRGTLEGLKKILSIYSQGAEVIINDFTEGDSLPDPSRPHYFFVTILLPAVNIPVFRQQRKIATAIIDLEKPAHTIYDLDVQAPAMQVGVISRCNVGVSTYLAPPRTPA